MVADDQLDVVFVADGNHIVGWTHCGLQRLLANDRLDAGSGSGDGDFTADPLPRRHADNVELLFLQQLAVVGVDSGHGILLGEVLCGLSADVG